jgi:Dolichyl-phosphate-mannose-protein mannosyltransferase
LTARQGFAGQAAAICLLVLALRLPFLNQAIQGDDFYYLKGAEHAQIDPPHPTHARYVFQGELVDMRGHPHPPLNSWYLAALLALTGDEQELPYHAAYVPWSLMAALGMLILARRFVPGRALPATVLFCATLPFIVNGTSLEADLPLLGCWMASVACFVAAVDRRSNALALAGFLFGVLAGLVAYQAIVLVPVLAFYLWQRRRGWLTGWAALTAAPAAIAAYQIFERLSSGAVPVSVLAGYMQTEGLQELSRKLRSAVALIAHAGWIVFPALAVFAFRRIRLWLWVIPALAAAAAAIYDPNSLFWASISAGTLVLVWCVNRVFDSDPDTSFLAAWVLLFFAAALVIFFAGAARYLLPIAAPVAILAAREVRPRWLYAGAAANALLAIGLAVVNYQHWDGYRDFAASVKGELASRRVWVNGEWGLRHYIESEGGLPLERNRLPRDGDLIVSSAYANAVQSPLVILRKREIDSAIPLRLVALGAKSGYSSIAFGLRPFDLSLAPMDIVRAEVVTERKPTLSRITIGTSDAADHIVSGVFNNDRWMSGRAIVVLRNPGSAARIDAVLFIPPASPARTFTLYSNGSVLARETFPGPGKYTLSAPAPGTDPVTIAIAADKTFTAPPDARALSALLLEIGFE